MTDNSLLQLSFPYIYGKNVASEYPQVSVSIERITPEIATKMLATNVKNRDIKNAPLSTLEESMSSGEWSLNGESIIFGDNGILIDGQHRLTACVKTGKTIDAIVVRGVQGDTQDTVDSGSRRQLAEYLKIDGYKNCTEVAAIGKMLMRKGDIGIIVTLFDNNITKRSIKAQRRFIHDIHDERIEPLIPSIRLITSRYKCIPTHLLGALFDEFRKAGDENYDEFVAQLAGKSVACMPVRLLQTKFIEHAKDSKSHGRGSFKNSVLAAYIIKTWNAYMRGDEMKRLTFNPGGKNPERFPEVFLGYE